MADLNDKIGKSKKEGTTDNMTIMLAMRDKFIRDINKLRDKHNVAGIVRPATEPKCHAWVRHQV